MKIFKKICDRCKCEISEGQHDDVNDFLEKQYPGKDICADCDLLLALANSLNSSDLITGSKPGTALRKMMADYDIQEGK